MLCFSSGVASTGIDPDNQIRTPRSEFSAMGKSPARGLSAFTSAPVLKSVSFYAFAARVRRQKALDAGQDIVGGLCPTEGFRVRIGSLDVSFDCFSRLA